MNQKIINYYTNSKRFTIILVFKVFKHILLDRDASPCESSAEYNIANCLEKKIIEEIGCKPKWIKHHSQFPVCQNKSKNLEYTSTLFKFSKMDKIKLQYESGCTKPCSYMEYRVISS